MRGFYRGYWATFWRDVPAYGAFFFSYEYIKRLMIKPDESPKTAYPKKLIATGIAGVFNWVPTYPFDVIKSIIQTCDGVRPKTIF